MTSDSVQVFRQSDIKQKDLCKLVQRSDYVREKEKSVQGLVESKPARKFKATKNCQEYRKPLRDTKIENVFLNSEYFKHQANNLSSLSFCSGDNGELRWTIDSNFETPLNQKNYKESSLIDATKNGAKEKEVCSSHSPGKSKSQSGNVANKVTPQGKTEKFIEGILSGRERIDRDLITLITEQMFLAERELQITRSHLIETIGKLNERELEIIELHEKLQNLQKCEKNNSSSQNSKVSSKTSEDYQRLVMASEKLKKQVKDMEEFLNDYGLVWIGDRETNSKPDFDKVIKNFQKLNSIACQPKIIQTTLGAKFELPREISVVLYSNGLLLRGNDFREYSKIATSLFLQDVEDGYFPSELQSEFPEGVPFEVTDKRNETYNVVPAIEIFKGTGNRLGSTFEDKPASVVFLEPVKETKSSISPPFGTFESSWKKTHKKRSRTVEDDRHSHYCKHSSSDKDSSDISIAFDSLTTLKIRFGKSKMESFVIELNENDRLSKFYDCLLEKLQKKREGGCSSSNPKSDFEVHVYGRNPFRLIDNLHRRLNEFGMERNCVINVWEI